MRQFLVPIAGVFAGGLVVAVVEALGHAIYPPPPFDGRDPASVRAMVSALPTGAFLSLVAAWTLGAFAGAAVALRLGSGRPRDAAIVGGVLLAATLANLAVLPHPAWVMVLGPLGIVAATYAAVRLVGARRPS